MKYIMLLAGCLLAAIATAETVYLNDGREIEGDVTREGQQVIITKPNGETVRVAESSVLYISGTTQPAATPAHDAKTTEEPTESFAPTATIVLDNAVMPETYVWTYMRRNQPDTADHYRRRVQDKQRKIGSQWYDPEDFVRRRKTYSDALLEGSRILEKAATLDIDARDTRTRTRNLRAYRRLRATGTRKLHDAASHWADPLLRRFLLGVAELHAEDYRAAILQFQNCLREAPHLAAFYQGLGLAQLGEGQHLDALESLTTVLKLRPETPEAAQLLRTAVEAVPGQYINSKAFIEAKTLLEKFPDEEEDGRRGRHDKIEWLLPSDVEGVSLHSLPVLEVDRYVMKQALAVPVGPQTLLTDVAALQGALRAYVELDADKVVPLALPRRWDDAAAPAVLVNAPLATFTPLVDADNIEDGNLPTPPEPGESVNVHGMNVLMEMGSEPRLFATTVKLELSPEADQVGQYALEAGLAPGEATAPVFDDQQKFVGLLAGKTDTDPANFTHRFYTLADLADIIEDVKPPRRSRRDPQLEPVKATGIVFKIIAIHGERFEATP